MRATHARTTFPLHNFTYLMRGRTVTADSVRHVLRALARQGQIPEVPYFTIVRCAGVEGLMMTLGNSLAIPTAEFVIEGIAEAAR